MNISEVEVSIFAQFFHHNNDQIKSISSLIDGNQKRKNQ